MNQDITLQQLQETITQQASEFVGTKKQIYIEVRNLVLRQLGGTSAIHVDYPTDGKTMLIRAKTPDYYGGRTFAIIEVNCKKSKKKNNLNTCWYDRRDTYEVKNITITPDYINPNYKYYTTPQDGWTVAEIIKWDIIESEISKTVRVDEFLKQQKEDIANIHRLLKDRDLSGLLNAYEKLPASTKKLLKETEN